jgi:hypothetical protein
MLLCWVLTRDKEAVLAMADEYGGWRIDGETAQRIQPSTWDDVLRAYAIDASLPKDERAREAVRRAQLSVIPARQEIFDALRSGKIEGWARPNGSGDIVRIDPIQWAGLRLHPHLNGHDIAVPVDSEGKPLSLPRPLDDYLAGAVSASFTPTVWPDPLFPGEQAMGLWPAAELLEVTRERTEAVEPSSASSSGIPFLYQTGLAGRPTAWSLIEAECRRRCGKGERHTTRAEWARVLINWLRSTHEGAPAVQPKTLTNKLGGLLRELEALPPTLDRRRPK